MNLRHYLLLSVLSMALFVAEENLFPLTVAMMLWLGVVLGLRLRPGIQSILADRRLPRASELAAILIGQAGAVATFLALALLPAAVTSGRGFLTLDVLTDVLPPVVCAAAAVGPLWLQMARPRRDHHPEPPLWPHAAGLFGGAALGLGLLFLLQGTIEPLFAERRFSDTLIGSLMLAPPGVLMTTFGGAWIAQALRGRPAVAPVFRLTATMGLVAWAAVAVGLGVDLAGGLRAVLPPGAGVQGGLVAAAYTIVIALAWIWSLWRIGRTEVASVLSAVVIVVMLVIGFLISLWVPAFIPRDIWAPLVAVVLFPFLLATAAGVVFALPPVMRRLVWARHRFPWARPAVATGPLAG